MLSFFGFNKNGVSLRKLFRQFVQAYSTMVEIQRL